MDTTDSGIMNGTPGSSGQNPMTVSVMPSPVDNRPSDGRSAAGPGPVLQFQVNPNLNANQAATPSFSVVNSTSQQQQQQQQYYAEPTGFAVSDFLQQLEDYTPTVYNNRELYL